MDSSALEKKRCDNVKVHEYQAKALMAEYGIPIPNGGVVSNINESLQVAQNLRSRVVVKAQVHAGGRGSAGGVKLVDTPDQAVQVVKSLLGADLVTSQTGPGGVPGCMGPSPGYPRVGSKSSGR